jgi:hypothetical protein
MFLLQELSQGHGIRIQVHIKIMQFRTLNPDILCYKQI